MKNIFTIMILLFSTQSFALSEPASKANFPTAMSYAGKSTTVRAVGLRKKFIFKVYAFGLYANAKTKKSSVFSPDNFLAIEMRFLRKVDAAAIAEAIQKSVQPKLSAADQKHLGKFGGMFKGKINQGDRLKFMWIGNRLVVLKNNQRIGSVPSNGFAKAFFQIYLGNKPIVASAKKQFMRSLR